MTNVNTASHTHSIPGLSIPGFLFQLCLFLDYPFLHTIPALSVDDHNHSIPESWSIPAALSIPALTIPALSATLPTSVVNYIIKT